MGSLADLAEDNNGRGIIYALEDIAKQLAVANAIAAMTATYPNGVPMFHLATDQQMRQLISSGINDFIPPAEATPVAPQEQPEASSS